MILLRKILVTTDLSHYSLAALEYASTLGLLYSSRLYLLHVVESHDRQQGGHGEAEAKKSLGAFVHGNISPDIKLVQVVRRGNPSDEIQRFAEEEGIDLIVIATHGRTGFGHIVMGSVAEKVVRHSSIPVLTVKLRPWRENNLKREDVENELHLR